MTWHRHGEDGVLETVSSYGEETTRQRPVLDVKELLVTLVKLALPILRAQIGKELAELLDGHARQ